MLAIEGNQCLAILLGNRRTACSQASAITTSLKARQGERRLHRVLARIHATLFVEPSNECAKLTQSTVEARAAQIQEFF